MDAKLAAILAFSHAKDFQAAHVCAGALVKQNPEDVRAQIAAAYACDRIGDESDALTHYEIAWHLGVPEEQRFEFLVGYSSTLRNMGRAQESLDRLQDANKERPVNAALLAFTALALHDIGNVELALATMLDAALKTADGNGLAPYTRALTEYRDELITKAGQRHHGA